MKSINFLIFFGFITSLSLQSNPDNQTWFERNKRPIYIAAGAIVGAAISVSAYVMLYRCIAKHIQSPPEKNLLH